MFNKVTIEKLEIDLTNGRTLHEALVELEKAGVDLRGFRVVKFSETAQRLTVQRVEEEKVKKPDIFKDNATPAQQPKHPTKYTPMFNPRVAGDEW